MLIEKPLYNYVRWFLFYKAKTANSGFLRYKREGVNKMNKSKIRGAVVFFTIVLLFSGCNENDDKDVLNQSSTTTKQTVALSETAGSITENKVELSDFATEVSDNCYFIEGTELPIETVIGLDDNTFVFTYSEYNDDGTNISYLSVTDLETGKNKETCIGGKGYFTAVEISGYIAVMSADNGILTIYNTELEKTDEYFFSVTDNGVYLITYVNDDMAEVHGTDNTISLVRVNDFGKIQIEERTFYVEDEYFFGGIAGSLSDDVLVATDYNGDGEHIYLWDTKSGNKTQINPECSPYSAYVIGNRIIGVDNENYKVNIYDQKCPNMVKSFMFSENYSVVKCNDSEDNIYFVSAGEEIFSVKSYSLETGDCTAEFAPRLELPGYIYHIAELEDYVAFMATINECTGIFVWEPEPIEEKESDFAILTGESCAALAYELEKTIETNYGIEIFSGEDAIRYFGGYAVKDETGEKTIYNALQEIDRVYSKLPVGFIDEMKGAYGEGAIMSIYLTGTIIPDKSESESISDAAAFTFLENEMNHVIVVDITLSGIDKTLAHELMHCIEDVIYTKGFEGFDLEMFERWEMLNPFDFRYAGTYTDENGNTIGCDVTEYIGTSYYIGGDMPLDNVYFVDGYATSYAKEDMARIFENIFFSESIPLPDYFGSVNLQLKSAYLCACIREAFNCLEGVEACWEKSINTDCTLDYFKENYDLDDYYYRISLEAVG